MNWVVSGKWFAAFLVFMAWVYGFEWLLKQDHHFWLCVYVFTPFAIFMGWMSARFEEHVDVKRHGSNHSPPVRMPPPPPNPPPRNP